MREIHKLEKNGEIIWPATTTTAVVDPDTKVVLQKSINSWNITNLWPDEDAKTIDAAVPVIAFHLPKEKKIPGVKVEFINSLGILEAWEFVGGESLLFTDVEGWKECGGNIISEIEKKVFPLETTLTVTPNIIPVGRSTEVTFDWGTMKAGNNITVKCSYYMDRNSVTGTVQKKETVSPSEYAIFTKTLTTSYKGETIETEVTYTAIQPTYYGIIDKDDIPDSSSVQELANNELKISKEFTTPSVTFSSRKYVYAYPAILGDLTSIKDMNGFEYLGSGEGFSKTTITLNSVLYNVYWLTTQATVTNFKYIFS